jgi:predicted nucleic acid-binding protein
MPATRCAAHETGCRRERRREAVRRSAARRGEPPVRESEAVSALLDRPETELFAPEHWRAEVIGVVARVDPSIVDDVILALHDMRPRVQTSLDVYKRAANLTVTLNHHLFDTLSHAVALEVGATFVTADEQYFRKAAGHGHIELLSAFQPPVP